jgi:hypothetical protein
MNTCIRMCAIGTCTCRMCTIGINTEAGCGSRVTGCMLI